jgi:uncharacterized protein (DUF362 family)
MRPIDGLISRREAIRCAAAAALAAALSGHTKAPPAAKRPANRRTRVAAVRVDAYSGELVWAMLEGAKACGFRVAGKTVLLKPNLVEFDSATVINTDAAFVAAAVETFERLGAARVLIAEGPGHRRDTLALAEEAGYFERIERFEKRFVDLNRDDVAAVSGFAGQSKFYFPCTALQADLIVSLPKMKTHHWAGVTLSMKNLFGVVPGSVYGWPKNLLHYIGIERSIVELSRMFPKTVAMVDGIVGMEGNGPIRGKAKHSGALIIGADLAAVDATCCRVMGINPEKVEFLKLAAAGCGIAEGNIEQAGQSITSLRSDFELLPQFRGLRLA